MRRLSEPQAQACETAATGRCRCRCRGDLHGAFRVANVYQLALDDPHYPDGQQLTLTVEPDVGSARHPQ
jgi:hypothetical protein